VLTLLVVEVKIVVLLHLEAMQMHRSGGGVTNLSALAKTTWCLSSTTLKNHAYPGIQL
jgi:hypothetical protein